MINIQSFIRHLLVAALFATASPVLLAQADPAAEPAVVAVKKTLPAVVNINTERVIRRLVQDPFDQLFNDFFGGPMRPPRELRHKVQSLGSGFLVDPSGYIVTNEHVVERAADLKIQVTTSDGKTYDAKFIASDDETDLAFIKIESKTPLPFINLEALSPNLLGQWVFVLGNPVGYGHSVSRGILSALERTLSIGDTEYKNLLQTDAAINPGNSGGPLIDLSGKLVGIASAKMAFTPQGVPTQGLGFAIPGSAVRAKVEEFKKIAKGEKSIKANVSLLQKLFGLSVQELTSDLADTLGYRVGSGVLISDVEEGSSAAKAGFERGLVLHRLGRYDVTSAREVENLLRGVTKGTAVDFTVGAIRRMGGRYVEQAQTVSLKAR